MRDYKAAASRMVQILRRWMASRHQRESEWQRLPVYWRVRRLWSDFTFSFLRREFAGRAWFRRTADSTLVLIQLLRATALMFLLALVVVVGLEIASRTLLDTFPPPSSAGQLPGVLVANWPILGTLAVDEPSMIGLLATSIQVAGVFLGLYFAAVSLVVNAYSANGAPESVRSRLVHELGRNRYIDLIALSGAVATLLLASVTIGVTPSFLNLVVVTLLGIVSILGFVVLGLRTFALLNPVSLTTGLLGSLYRWVLAATTAGHRWAEVTIQDYYRRHALRLLTTYRELADFSMSPERSSPEGIADLARSAVWFLERYSLDKTKMPTSSHWFDRVPEHRSWLTESHVRIDFLLRAGWQGAAEKTSDPLWVERLVQPIVEEALGLLATQQTLGKAADLAGVCHNALWSMANRYALDEALLLENRISRSFDPAIYSRQIKIEDLAEVDPHVELALGLNELACMGLTSICLGLTRALEAMTLERFTEAIQGISWDRPATIYVTRTPRQVRTQIELLAGRLEFERLIEGQIHTPLWYQQQFVARSLVDYMHTAVGQLISRLEERFSSTVESDIEQQQFVLATERLSRGLEACEKLRVLIAFAKDRSTALASLRRLPEEPWPQTDWDGASQRVRSERRRLVKLLGRCGPMIASTEPPSTRWPDYFGYSYRILANECVSALSEGDHELYAGLFSGFFMASLSARDRLIKETEGAYEPSRSVFATEPIADLLFISGLAKLYSELDASNVWQVTSRVWDLYLERAQDPRALINFFAVVIQYRSSIFMMAPSDAVRTGWKMQLEKTLRERGLLTNDIFSPIDRRASVSHPSPVIRAYIASGGLQTPVLTDVFVVMYLKKNDDGDQITLSRSQQWFNARLQQAEQQSPEAED